MSTIEIRAKLINDGVRFHASDNISGYVGGYQRELIVSELEEKFKEILDSLIIDWRNDPNSKDTPRRLAEMYVFELLAGRYFPRPEITAFPNIGENAYKGMLVVRAEIKSMCSHHHQTVKGIAYIGVIPGDKVIGLSKYVRIAQWCARRGTLQENLCNMIADEIMKAIETKDVGVYIHATHGCMENRGVEVHSSLTQTTVLHGLFNEPDVKKEFFDNIALQEKRL